MCRRLHFPTFASDPGSIAVEPHYLTGHDYLPQTLFAIKSWVKFSGRSVRPQLYDDGSLTSREVSELRARVPGIDVHRSDAIIAKLDDRLPAGRFPFLRRLRLAYPHLRKLTDIHVGRRGWTLVSDSDVLLFRRPGELLAHLETGTPFFMRDCAQSYGAPHAFLNQLAGQVVPPMLNCGLYHVRSDGINWEFLEAACVRLLAAHGFSFYLEQALSALVLTAAGGVELGPDYVVNPDTVEGRNPTKTALHYLQSWGNPDMEHAWSRLSDEA